jgi:nucleoid DNA-binding protein
MTKEEISRAIWNELPNHTLKKARQAYDTTFNLIRDRLAKGEDIELRGLGNFKIREKNERMGRNPKTGVKAVIKPRKVVTFKPSKILKDRVNNSIDNE